ncbi:MAG TPA: Gfo/Idh/MocA family oxidoreductase [Chthoniobacterales bacterium]
MSDDFTRRKFLRGVTQGVLASAVLKAGESGAQAAATGPASNALSQGQLKEAVKLGPLSASTEQSSGEPPLPLPPQRRIGIAVVGLGHLSINQILPAFGSSKRVKVTGLVSGDAAKARALAAMHGVPERSIYDYQSFDRIGENPDIDAVYIVLPNSLHAEYTVRAAQAGKHVLCEKPMATSARECEQMITACKVENRKLMIAYRIQYEPHNRMVQRSVRNGAFGPVKLIEAVNGQNQGDPEQWRQKKALAGGGSLPDVGLYCLNTTRFLLGEEPTEVSAMLYSTPNDPRFREVEENVIWQMRFPSGALAHCATGYGFHESRRYRVYGEKSWIGMDPAFSYTNLQVESSKAEGPIEERSRLSMQPKDQFALEMDHFGGCVQEDKTPYTPGEEGLQDQTLMEAIYEAARSGRPVLLNSDASARLDRFRGPDPQS